MCIEQLSIFSIMETANSWAVFRHQLKILMATFCSFYLVIFIQINQIPNKIVIMNRHHRNRHRHNNGEIVAHHHGMMTTEMSNSIVINAVGCSYYFGNTFTCHNFRLKEATPANTNKTNI